MEHCDRGRISGLDMACFRRIELLRAPMEAAANKTRKACWYKCWYRRAGIGRKHTKA